MTRTPDEVMELLKQAKSMPDAVMKEMAKVALEHAMQAIAEHARLTAATIPPGISGREALEIFADTILSVNAKTWTKENPQ